MFRHARYVMLLNAVSYRTAIGLRVKDGIVLAVEKIIHSKLLVPDANRRIQSIDKHLGLVCHTITPIPYLRAQCSPSS